VLLAKLSRNYAEMSSRISSKEEKYASGVGYCVSQLIAVCVLYTEIKISTLFEEMVRFIRKLNLALLLGHPTHKNKQTSVHPYTHTYIRTYIHTVYRI